MAPKKNRTQEKANNEEQETSQESDYTDKLKEIEEDDDSESAKVMELNPSIAETGSALEQSSRALTDTAKEGENQEPIMDLMNNTAVQTPLNCTVDTRYRFTYYQISYSLIFICGLASNGVALWRLWLMPWTVTSSMVYMANLAVVDLFFILSLPLRIHYYYNRSHSMAWSPGSVFCQLTFALKYISMYGGIFFLACIGLDRYLAVMRPVLRQPKNVHNTCVLSTTIWLLVLALSSALPFIHSAASTSHHTCLLDPSLGHHQTLILAALGLVLVAFLLPALLLLFSYCRVLRVLGRMPHRGKSRHRRTLSLIYCVLGIFLLCFAPYHTNLLCYTLTQVGVVTSCSLAKFASALHPIMLSLASTNCCLNPLVYYCSSSLMQKDAPSGQSNLKADSRFGSRRKKLMGKSSP
ncbi:hypothetical protein QTP70_028063 [Hemibagrus guttatus]|uniref:G-protein coupled receptors family 1 profile domain-containing protein n=1 Tax=Hemibagrus guttatus TaxID=175788 RepID=A0AAE0QMK6_9TELE|nr:hypothetical protein QTP70_028063 [Hemibagrus guttatus]